VVACFFTGGVLAADGFVAFDNFFSGVKISFSRIRFLDADVGVDVVALVLVFDKMKSSSLASSESSTMIFLAFFGRTLN